MKRECTARDVRSCPPLPEFPEIPDSPSPRQSSCGRIRLPRLPFMCRECQNKAKEPPVSPTTLQHAFSNNVKGSSFTRSDNNTPDSTGRLPTTPHNPCSPSASKENCNQGMKSSYIEFQPTSAFLRDTSPHMSDFRKGMQTLNENSRLVGETLPEKELIRVPLDKLFCENIESAGVHQTQVTSGPQGLRAGCLPKHLKKKPLKKCCSQLSEPEAQHCRLQQGVEREMMDRYELLKNEYAKVCNQETLLRHQMALLGAQIILLQTKSYHKSPAHMRTINIDPISIRKLQRSRNSRTTGNIVVQHVTLTNATHPSGRYFNKKTNTLNNAVIDVDAGKRPKSEDAGLPPNMTPLSHLLNQGLYGECFCNDAGLEKSYYFDIPLPMIPPPYTGIPQYNQEKITKHRLTKFPDINDRKRKH